MVRKCESQHRRHDLEIRNQNTLVAIFRERAFALSKFTTSHNLKNPSQEILKKDKKDGEPRPVYFTNRDKDIICEAVNDYERGADRDIRGDERLLKGSVVKYESILRTCGVNKKPHGGNKTTDSKDVSSDDEFFEDMKLRCVEKLANKRLACVPGAGGDTSGAVATANRVMSRYMSHRSKDMQEYEYFELLRKFEKKKKAMDMVRDLEEEASLLASGGPSTKPKPRPPTIGVGNVPGNNSNAGTTSRGGMISTGAGGLKSSGCYVREFQRSARPHIPNQTAPRCFFSMLCNTFRKLAEYSGTLAKVEKRIKTFQSTMWFASLSWGRSEEDWSLNVQSALHFLANENFSFPNGWVVRYDLQKKKYVWNPSEMEDEVMLMDACSYWNAYQGTSVPGLLEEVDPPLVPVRTTGPDAIEALRPYTDSELAEFHEQERRRYANATQPFTYKVLGGKIVGTVMALKPMGSAKAGERGGGQNNTEATGGNIARDHSLLVKERPNTVSLAGLVRDACARLPNGVGTRKDIVLLVEQSRFIGDEVEPGNLNSMLGNALDRLCYEKDPCVQYDPLTNIWVYRHRCRSISDFERIRSESTNNWKKHIIDTGLLGAADTAGGSNEWFDFTLEPEPRHSGLYARVCAEMKRSFATAFSDSEDEDGVTKNMGGNMSDGVSFKAQPNGR
eukprot:Nk52_evm57s485 gene=Nk52_evmTU57s485